jgi:hypothetical protein
MCMFTRPVNLVENTRVFARLSSSRKSQYLVYQMQYEAGEPTAMVLPIPVTKPTHENSLRFIDLSGYSEFFSDLAKGFPVIIDPYVKSAVIETTHAPQLKVFQIGNYEGSFVPNVADFSLLDERFRFSDAIWSKIPQYKNFAFVVFQLTAGSLKPHPMAFEFDYEGKEIYFPTMHIHDGVIHRREEFDHALYLQHAELDSRVGEYKNFEGYDHTTKLIRSQATAENYCNMSTAQGILLGNLLIHKHVIRGKQPNRDFTLAVTGDSDIVPAKPLWLLAVAPFLLILTLLGWFFARRNTISKSVQVTDTF